MSAYRRNSPPPPEPSEPEPRRTLRRRIKDNVDHPFVRILTVPALLGTMLGIGNAVLPEPLMCTSERACSFVTKQGIALGVGLLLLACLFIVGMVCYIFYVETGEFLARLKNEL